MISQELRRDCSRNLIVLHVADIAKFILTATIVGCVVVVEDYRDTSSVKSKTTLLSNCNVFCFKSLLSICILVSLVFLVSSICTLYENKESQDIGFLFMNKKGFEYKGCLSNFIVFVYVIHYIFSIFV